MSTRSGRIRQSLIDKSSGVRKGVSPPRSPARSRKSSPPAPITRKSPSRKSPSRKPVRTSSPKYPARKSPARTVKEKIIEVVDPAVPKPPAKRLAIKTNAIVKLDEASTRYEIYRSTRSKQTEYLVNDYSPSVPMDFTIGEKPNDVKLESDSNSLGVIYGLRSRRLEYDALPFPASKLWETTDNMPDIRHSFSKSPSKSLSKSASKSVSKSVDAYSEKENSEEDAQIQNEKRLSMTRRLATPLPSTIASLIPSGKFEFGGRVGTVPLILLIPITVLAILISCTKSCSYVYMSDLFAYKLYVMWLNKKLLMLILSQYFIQAAFVSIPIFGKQVQKVDETGRSYCFNAIFATFCTIILIPSLELFKIDVNIVLSSYLGLASISYLLGVVLSLILYVKSHRVDVNYMNPYGNTGYIVIDFLMGRELHPYIMKLNVKLWISRISNITSVVLTILILKHGIILPEYNLLDLTVDNFTEFISMINFKPTVILFSMMQLIYILIFVVKEYQTTSTFFWQCEGLGYLQIVSSALYPFYFTTISKFVLDTNISLKFNQLIVAATLYFLGCLIMVRSNDIKHEFRQNPLQPSLALLDSMPTFLGKKLLVSRLWGVVRHPNYTGDILIHISLALPGMLSQHTVAAAPAVITIFVLLHRAWRDHARCQRRYGAAWHRYCKRVPSLVVPKVL